MRREYLLDTNMVSYIVKGRSAVARARLTGLGVGEVASISAITEAELRYGLAKLPESTGRHAAVNWFLTRLQILPWGREEAAVYGDLRARQEAAGKVLASMDLLIAAHAVARGAVLVTHDRVFAQVQELVAVEDWAGDL